MRNSNKTNTNLGIRARTTLFYVKNGALMAFMVGTFYFMQTEGVKEQIRLRPRVRVVQQYETNTPAMESSESLKSLQKQVDQFSIQKKGEASSVAQAEALETRLSIYEEISDLELRVALHEHDSTFDQLTYKKRILSLQQRAASTTYQME